MSLLRSVRLEDGTEFNVLDVGGSPAVAAALVPTSYVVDPAQGPPGGGNVFATLAAAAVIMAAVAGVKFVEARGAVAPASQAYALGPDPVDFRGQASGPISSLAFAAGSTITGNAALTFQDLVVSVGPGAPLVTVPSGITQNYRFRNCQSINGTLVRAGAGGSSNVFVEELTSTGVGATTIFDAVGAGALAIVIVDNFAGIGANHLAQSAGGTLLALTVSPSASVSLTQAGMPGGVLVVGTNLLVESAIGQVTGPGGGAPALQAGTIQLAAGTTALIPATIASNSRIKVNVRTMTPGAGNLTVQYSALTADRVIGLAGGGGGFKCTALLSAGTINVLDTSFVDWEVTS